MKILFCSSAPLDPSLGLSKALIELAGAMERLGWSCQLAGSDEICPEARRLSVAPALAFTFALRKFVRERAGGFDVVDFDLPHLPFERSLFPPSTLMVARSALLHHHFETIRVPRLGGLRSWAGLATKGPARALSMKMRIWSSSLAIRSADLVNVNNDYDRAELERRRFDPAKIVVVPLGLTDARLKSFASPSSPGEGPPRVAFVGTFDARKGGRDLPLIAQRIVDAVPGCRLRLMGVKRSDRDVLRYFPAGVRPSIEVIPSFDPDALPRLLQGCSIGIFPSYVEGFGFGVLEMLAASLPVIAYDAPGPPMMLPPELLVPRGAARELASKTIALLRDHERLVAAREWARRRAGEFTWEHAAKTTSAIYADRLSRLRASR